MAHPIPRKHLEISQVRPYTLTTRSYLTRYLLTRCLTALSSCHQEDGAQHRAKIIALIDNHLAENDFEKQPARVKFKCLVNDKYEEIVACNDIVDYIEADDTWDG